MAGLGRRAAVATIVVTVVASVPTACSGDRDALTIYSGREEALVRPILERFAEEKGVDVNIRYGDSVDLALLIEEEGEDTPADVFFSQSPGTVGFLGSEGMLASIDERVLGKVDPKFESSDGEWIGITARQRVLVYNPELVGEEDLPDSVFDLTDERYAGDVGLAPTNASFQDFVTAMRLVEGEDAASDWLQAMSDNGNPVYADNSSIVAAVGRGEIPMGLVNHYYNYRALEEDPDAPSRNYTFPPSDIGSLMIASTVSILRSSEHKEEAAEFVDFLLSREAQEFFSRETFEYPLVPGVEAADVLPPFESLEAVDFDIDRLGGDLKSTADMISDSGLL
jgi:iron(III) transport system substrate-binding protein